MEPLAKFPEFWLYYRNKITDEITYLVLNKEGQVVQWSERPDNNWSLSNKSHSSSCILSFDEKDHEISYRYETSYMGVDKHTNKLYCMCWNGQHKCVFKPSKSKIVVVDRGRAFIDSHDTDEEVMVEFPGFLLLK